MRWLFNRRVGLTLLWIGVLLVVAFIVNVLGIQLAGNMQNWAVWIKEHAFAFLFWRIVLYLAVGVGWWWMHKRLMQRENTPQAKTRLLRIEIAALCSVLVLEISNWMA
ncbi:MAG: hypothetical protein ACRCWR_08505 [Saezia sp.]